MNKIESLIEKLHLKPHPEGGWYAETYRSAENIPADALPRRFTGDRSFYTAIYFLLPGNTFSAFHRIKSDECWHFYEGVGLDIFIIDKGGLLSVIKLGGDLEKGEVFQFVVPAACWFASRPSVQQGYSLVGCTVAPGFDFTDFEMADGDALSAGYPQYEDLIRSLSREREAGGGNREA